jgi:hypothetical protein
MNDQVLVRNFVFSWDLGKILVRIGHKSGLNSAPPSLLRHIKEIEAGLDSFLRPQGAYVIIGRDETNSHPIFDHAVLVALGVITVGAGLEKESESSFQGGDMLKGLILDAFGSEATVQVFKTVERRIVEEALARGLWPSRRFSPGYKGWPLEEQGFLFSKVDAAAIGVRLNESFMMIPRKSNSFRINFYADRCLTTRRMT